MYTQPFRLALYSLLISLLFFSCKKEKRDFETLELTVELVDGKYVCNWTKSDIATFEYYHLYYSLEPFDDDPLTLEFDEDVVFFDQETSTWDFVLQNFAPTLYFRLEIGIEGRTISSNIVEVFNSDIHSIEIDAERVIHYPEKNALYILEVNTNRLIYFDYATGEIKKERDIGFKFTSGVSGNNGFGEELYVLDFSNKLKVLDANTLEEKASLSFTAQGLTLFSVATNDKGFIYLAIRENGKPLQVYKRDGLTLHAFHDSIDADEDRGLTFLSKEDNQLLDVGESNNLYLFNFSDDGDLISSVTSSNQFSVSLENKIISVSPQKNYFVKSRDGVVFNSSLDLLFDARSFFNKTYNSFAFDESETYLYTAIDAASPFGFKFQRLTMSDFSFEEKALNDYDPIFLYNYAGKIMTVAKHEESNTLKIFPLVF